MHGVLDYSYRIVSVRARIVCSLLSITNTNVALFYKICVCLKMAHQSAKLSENMLI